MQTGRIRTNLSACFFADTAGEQFHGANTVSKIISHTADHVCSDLRVLIVWEQFRDKTTKPSHYSFVNTCYKN